MNFPKDKDYFNTMYIVSRLFFAAAAVRGQEESIRKPERTYQIVMQNIVKHLNTFIRFYRFLASLVRSCSVAGTPQKNSDSPKGTAIFIRYCRFEITTSDRQQPVPYRLRYP